MLNVSLSNEAKSCREMASEFAGRPEEPFLLRLASAMEKLTLIQERVQRAPASEASAA
jgi:hypothetical protein